MSTNKEKIITMFYEEHLLPSDIANDLNVSKAYITKVINKDSRYNKEKLERRNSNKLNRNERNKIKARVKRQEKQSKDILKIQHDIDCMTLSTPSRLSDEDFAGWNLSIYKRNKNYDLVATKDVNLTYDVPKFISMKRILPPQNYRYNNV